MISAFKKLVQLRRRRIMHEQIAATTAPAYTSILSTAIECAQVINRAAIKFPAMDDQLAFPLNASAATAAHCIGIFCMVTGVPLSEALVEFDASLRETLQQAKAGMNQKLAGSVFKITD